MGESERIGHATVRGYSDDERFHLISVAQPKTDTCPWASQWTVRKEISEKFPERTRGIPERPARRVGSHQLYIGDYKLFERGNAPLPQSVVEYKIRFWSIIPETGWQNRFYVAYGTYVRTGVRILIRVRRGLPDLLPYPHAEPQNNFPGFCRGKTQLSGSRTAYHWKNHQEKYPAETGNPDHETVVESTYHQWQDQSNRTRANDTGFRWKFRRDNRRWRRFQSGSGAIPQNDRFPLHRGIWYDGMRPDHLLRRLETFQAGIMR